AGSSPSIPVTEPKSAPPSASAVSATAPIVAIALIAPSTSRLRQAWPPSSPKAANSICGTGLPPRSVARMATMSPTPNTGVSRVGTSGPTRGSTDGTRRRNTSKTTRASSASGFFPSRRKPPITQRAPWAASTRRTCMAPPPALVPGWFMRSEGVQPPLPGSPGAQDPFEVDGILRRHHLGRTRAVVVEQARQPEPECGGAQHHRPRLHLRLAERALGAVGREHRVGARLVDLAAFVVDAPVVDRHGEVEEPGIDPGEVEVDHAAQARPLRRRLEQDVVAKQVRMHRAALKRAAGGARREPLLGEELVVEDPALPGIEEGAHRRRDLQPPGQAAQVRQPAL